MSCERCKADPHPAGFGDPRKCAFTADGEFTPDNWNCATLQALMDLDIDTTYRCDIEGDDESMQIIGARPGREHGGYIVLTRYKHRGRTSSAMFVGDFWPARPLTLWLAMVALKTVVEPESW